MQGTPEFANPLFDYEIRHGVRLRAEALVRIDGVLLLVHELAMVEADSFAEALAPLKAAWENRNCDDIRKIPSGAASALKSGPPHFHHRTLLLASAEISNGADSRTGLKNDLLAA